MRDFKIALLFLNNLYYVFAYYDDIDRYLIADSSCRLMNDKERLPDNNNCQIYYTCADGEMMYRFCERNQHFDKQQKECVLAEEYPCENRRQMKTTTLQPSTTTAVPEPIIERVTPSENDTTSLCYRSHGSTVKESDNCRSYSVCWRGISHKGECPNGYSYNEDNELCDIANNYRCEVDSICPPTGIHSFRKLGSCSEYNFCFAGKHLVRQCDEGLQFDSKRNRCALPAVAACFACPVLDNIDELVTHSGRECDVYYICRNGDVERFRCATGLHWNQKVQRCSLPENVICKMRNY